MSTVRYTFVLEFQGGTYVSQTQATDEIDAVRRWCAQLAAITPAGRASKGLAKGILEGLESAPPVALDDLAGVWCLTSTYGRSPALLNIVRSA